MASYNFGARDARMKQWSSDGVYTGSEVDLTGVTMVTVTPQMTEAELPGDDIIVDTHIMEQSVTVQFRAGNEFTTGFDAIKMLTGGTETSSATGRRLVVNVSSAAPYVGITAQAIDTNGVTSRLLFVPKAKLQPGFSFTMQNGQYNVHEMTLKGIPDSTYGLWQLYHIANVSAQTVPPTF